MLLGIAGEDVELVGGVTSMGLLEECLEKLAVAQSSHTDRLPELLENVLSKGHPESRVVVISPRRTDLSDTQRFETIWQKPRERSALGRVVCLNVDSPEFRSCFEPKDSTPTERPVAGFHGRPN